MADLGWTTGRKRRTRLQRTDKRIYVTAQVMGGADHEGIEARKEDNYLIIVKS